VKENFTDRISHILILVAFCLAGIASIIAPILALSWSRHPFPGFVVEQTLVVANYGGSGWPGHLAGITFPQRVTQLDDLPVITSDDFNATIDSLPPGSNLQVRAILPDGTTQTYSTSLLARFPMRDLIRLFWLPYSIGLAYLAIGIWVYRIKGPSRSCRAFAFISASVALVTMLFFDLISTHLLPMLWTLAVAVLGSALISLSLLFPTEWAFVQNRPWLRLVPYGITLFLAAQSFREIFENTSPWNYINSWRASYIYAALGIVFFLVTMILRLRFRYSLMVRRQAQIILVGSFLAFFPQGIWFVSPMFGFQMSYDPLVFLPLLLCFPLSIALALLRYHLWNVDVIIRRTLIYSVLSLLLVIVYFSSVVLIQGLFEAISGQKSTIAIVLSTLAIAALSNPLRIRVQDFIDRRFYRRKYNAEQALAQFAATARDEVDMDKLITALLEVVEETVQPEKLTLLIQKETQ
jgi:hypothetical protein